MKVSTVAVPSLVSPSLDQRVRTDITTALGRVRTVDGAFIVNDSSWFAVNDRGKVTPCVMNSAKFISSIFQTSLAEHGWSLEKEIIGQAIDAYIELPQSGQTYRVPENRFLEYFQEYIASVRTSGDAPTGDLDRVFTQLYGAQVSRPFVFSGALPDPLVRYAEPVQEAALMRLGLEFETGNIASSFRALQKLALLYAAREIDAGVFITSIDKASCATRIWPPSNRNGSFQELKQRNYQRMVGLPLWEFGFAPDGFSRMIGYLGSGGTVYMPTVTGKKYEASGVTYDVHIGERGKQVLRLTEPALLA